MLLSTLVRPLYCLHLLDLCTHPAGPHAGHAPGADVVVRDDAVLDAERAEADVAHALLARLVRHNGRVHLHHTAQLREAPADSHLHQRVGDVALVEGEPPASQPSLVPVGIVVLVLAIRWSQVRAHRRLSAILTMEGRHAGQILFLLQLRAESSSSLRTARSFSNREIPTGWPSLSPRNGW